MQDFLDRKQTPHPVDRGRWRSIPLLLCAVMLGSAWGSHSDSLALEKVHGGALVIEDADITLAVETELLLDGAVPARLIDVSTEDGVVTLSGSVNNWLAGERAVTLAESIKGVRSVLNHIKVRPRGERSDEALAQDVNAALARDPATAAYLVEAHVKDGRVTLTGEAGSHAERQLARRVAGGVRGVIDVENQITVEAEEDRPDTAIEEEVEARLAWDAWVDASKIDVEVKDGLVTLAGTVGSAQERTRAYVDA